MKRLWSLSMVMIFLALAAAAVAAPRRRRSTTRWRAEKRNASTRVNLPITILAAEKGVKATVVIRQNRIKGQRIKKGQFLKINTSHIVPTEVENGFVINLPELLLYHFVNGAYQRRYTLAIGKPSWPTPTGTYKIDGQAREPHLDRAAVHPGGDGGPGPGGGGKGAAGAQKSPGQVLYVDLGRGGGHPRHQPALERGLLRLPWLHAHAAQRDLPALSPGKGGHSR